MPTIVHTLILGVLWCKCNWNFHNVLNLNSHPFFRLFNILMFNVMELTSYISFPDKIYFIPKRCSLNFYLQCMTLSVSMPENQSNSVSHYIKICLLPLSDAWRYEYVAKCSHIELTIRIIFVTITFCSENKGPIRNHGCILQ